MTRCQMAHSRHQTIRLAAYSAGSRYAPAQQIVVYVPEIQAVVLDSVSKKSTVWSD
jgi:hypothetical protein